MSFISKRPLEVFVLETVVCLVYKAQAAQTHVTRKECKVIYLLQWLVTFLLDAPVSRSRRPLKIRDFVWEIKYWDLRTLNNVKSNFSFNEMNKKDLPAMYSTEFRYVLVVLLFKVGEHSFGSLWLYVICQIMARERFLVTSWNLATEKCTDERFWLTGKSWRFRSFHGNMNDWIQPYNFTFSQFT